MDAGLLDHAGRDDRRRDVGRAGEDARLADGAGQGIGAGDAVLQRQHDRLGTAQRRQQRQHLRVGVGLHREDDEVDGADAGRVAVRLDAHHVIAERAPHQQPALADGAQVRAAGDERHALAAAREPRPVVAPDGAGADHGDVHVMPEVEPELS